MNGANSKGNVYAAGSTSGSPPDQSMGAGSSPSSIPAGNVTPPLNSNDFQSSLEDSPSKAHAPQSHDGGKGSSTVIHASPVREDRKGAESVRGNPAAVVTWSPRKQPQPIEAEQEVQLDVKSNLAWGTGVRAALANQSEQNRIRMEWLKVLESHDTHGFPLETSFLQDADTQPSTQDELQALKRLGESLKAQNQKSQPAPAAARFEALFEAYKEHTPSVIRRGGALRTATTLEALLKAGITPEKLHQACFMSLVRDVGAQLTASTAAYTGSFYTLNALSSFLIRKQFDDPTQLMVPPLAHTAASLLVARFLRAAEMGPGWTRAVEADSKGAASAAILTKPGFAKTVAQYWPFFAPLLWASLALPDPADTSDSTEKRDRSAARVEFRRDWGFLASAGVALHRIGAFDREHVWLDARTEPKRLAMLGAIQELTSPFETLTSLGKYMVVRPLAGIAGLFGRDAHPVINKASESLRGIDCKDPSLAAGTKSVSISGYLQKKGVSATRAFLLLAPMGLFSTARRFTASAPSHSNLINVANDAFLIGAWGYGMARQERLIATDAPGEGAVNPAKSLQAENAARATRQTMALARRARDVAPQS